MPGKNNSHKSMSLIKEKNEKNMYIMTIVDNDIN